jgi:hypothetical protein
LSATLLALLPAGPANAEDEDDEDDEDDEERKKILPRPVSLGLKAMVVAGTLYALAELYTAPKIETETRRGEEATGERVLLCLCPCNGNTPLSLSLSQPFLFVSHFLDFAVALCRKPSHSYVSRPSTKMSSALTLVCLKASQQYV